MSSGDEAWIEQRAGMRPVWFYPWEQTTSGEQMNVMEGPSLGAASLIGLLGYTSWWYVAVRTYSGWASKIVTLAPLRARRRAAAAPAVPSPETPTVSEEGDVDAVVVANVRGRSRWTARRHGESVEANMKEQHSRAAAS